MNTTMKGVRKEVVDPDHTYVTADASYGHGKNPDVMGYTFRLNSALIAYKSKKLCRTASPAEAEAKAIAEAAAAAIWIIRQATWMNILPPESRIVFFNDNTTALLNSERPSGSSRKLDGQSKSVYIAQQHISEHFLLKHRESKSLEADLLTKPIARNKAAQARKDLLHTHNRNSGSTRPPPAPDPASLTTHTTLSTHSQSPSLQEGEVC